MIYLKQGEADVMKLIAKGYTEKQIAKKLNLSHSGIKYRKKMIFIKYDVGTVAELLVKNHNMNLKENGLPRGNKA
jgi:DNA-binding NarL/FixJ family response regulator